MSDAPMSHGERLYFLLWWEGSRELFYCSDRLSRKEANVLIRALDPERVLSITWTAESRRKKADLIRMRVQAKGLEEYLDPNKCNPFGMFIPVGAVSYCQ